MPTKTHGGMTLDAKIIDTFRGRAMITSVHIQNFKKEIKVHLAPRIPGREVAR
jgi:hypothetical protein